MVIIDRLVARQTDRQTDRQAYRHKDTQIGRDINRSTFRQINIQTEE